MFYNSQFWVHLIDDKAPISHAYFIIGLLSSIKIRLLFLFKLIVLSFTHHQQFISAEKWFILKRVLKLIDKLSLLYLFMSQLSQKYFELMLTLCYQLVHILFLLLLFNRVNIRLVIINFIHFFDIGLVGFFLLVFINLLHMLLQKIKENCNINETSNLLHPMIKWEEV